ncbi:MAG: hypothetical protein P8Y51_10570 [Campylobacterales bacterium]
MFDEIGRGRERLLIPGRIHPKAIAVRHFIAFFLFQTRFDKMLIGLDPQTVDVHHVGVRRFATGRWAGTIQIKKIMTRVSIGIGIRNGLQTDQQHQYGRRHKHICFHIDHLFSLLGYCIEIGLNTKCLTQVMTELQGQVISANQSITENGTGYIL